MERGRNHSLKLITYPAVIFSIALLLGTVGLFLSKTQIDVWVGPESAKLPTHSEPVALRESAGDRIIAATAPTTMPQPFSEIAPAAPVASPKPAPIAVVKPGNIRVSNQTEHPVRIALLTRSAAPGSGKSASYGEPAHWDFEPEEGSLKGLALSLPGKPLKLQKGDILVAFAQDGSRRYWGPYVVGETPSPIWNRQASEWQLVLNDGR